MTFGLLLVVILVCLAVFVNGWTDAPNAIRTVITTRVLSPSVAIILASVFNFLGVILSGSAVAATTGRIVDFESGQLGLVAIASAMLALILWAVGAWKFGIPTSETHALVAGLMGAGLASEGWSAINTDSILLVVYGLVVSGLIGFGLSFVFTILIRNITLAKNTNRRTANRFFSSGQILSSILLSFSHGAQDGQKFMGVLFITCVLGKQIQSPEGAAWDLPLEILIIVAVVMAFGTSFGAYRIVKHMGMDMVQLKKYQGFAAEVAASTSIIGATVLGIPLSTTQTKASALMGAAASEGLRKVRWPVANEILMAWVLTFPACMVMGFGFAKILSIYI